MNKRTEEVCGDCMWRVYDREGSCWDFCYGKYKPSKKPKELVK